MRRKYLKHYIQAEIRGKAICERHGHRMCHDLTWKQRRKQVCEKFWCFDCHMEMFIDVKSSREQLHGIALYFDCIKEKHNGIQEP